MRKRAAVVLLSSEDYDESPSCAPARARVSSRPVPRSAPTARKRPRGRGFKKDPSSASREVRVVEFDMLSEDFCEHLHDFSITEGVIHTKKKELWAEKHKPHSLAELAVHKKPTFRSMTESHESDNMRQLIAASVAARGVLFGNSHPSPSSIGDTDGTLSELQRSSKLRGHHDKISVSSIATEYRPTIKWLCSRTISENIRGADDTSFSDEDLEEIGSEENEEDDIEDWFFHGPVKYDPELYRHLQPLPLADGRKGGVLENAMHDFRSNRKAARKL